MDEAPDAEWMHIYYRIRIPNFHSLKGSICNVYDNRHNNWSDEIGIKINKKIHTI